MSDLQRNMINYMVVCVNDYADRHGLSYAETFDSANAMKDLWHEVVPRFKHGVS